jgi:hypothetical protein
MVKYEQKKRNKVLEKKTSACTHNWRGKKFVFEGGDGKQVEEGKCVRDR